MDAAAIIALINSTLQIVAQVTPLLTATDQTQVAAALAQMQSVSDTLHANADSVGKD